jgi:hypothetical protein
MVRAFGTLAVVSAGVLGFWIGYLLDARRHTSSAEPRRAPLAA